MTFFTVWVDFRMYRVYFDGVNLRYEGNGAFVVKGKQN